MTSNKNRSRIHGFYNLDLEGRMGELANRVRLSPEDQDVLVGTAGLTVQQAQHMIENVVGIYSLPLGIGLNFMINGRDVLIPMVIEEPSVVAGASYMAKLARKGGGFRASVSSNEMIGQIQVVDIGDVEKARKAILENKDKLLKSIENIDPVLTELGGGPRDLEVRLLHEPHVGSFLVVHLIFDVKDAMGANVINSACEALAPSIEEISGGRVILRILSNLADRRLARASCTIPVDTLEFNGYSGEEVRDGIILAWTFASVDPYRATTHNKGIMNGIDAVVMATANDWRAIEAGAHAYAARSGHYTSLSTWESDENGNLVGKLEMPLAVGIVGGATRVHPTARVALKIMGVETASQLAEIIVSVGLAQNLAALRALATEGIQRGHMNLHARQVAIAAGAASEEINQLTLLLVLDGTIRIDRAVELLDEIRKGKT
jgi:hydroxymethylglutaryl-CoA reductase